ncbi:hypothetical protein ACH4D5_33940 [Streptomyces sp. NPDC018029]|uniref:hypothetical protein n=1 Tax=Streptomyces sp. NPDC018029 TaxID=3365032 RepID=UPI0037BCCB82
MMVVLLARPSDEPIDVGHTVQLALIRDHDGLAPLSQTETKSLTQAHAESGRLRRQPAHPGRSAKRVEGQIRTAVDAGETIDGKVTPIYRTNDPGDVIPLGMTLEAHGNRGFSFTPYEGESSTNSVSTFNAPKPN